MGEGLLDGENVAVRNRPVVAVRFQLGQTVFTGPGEGDEDPGSVRQGEEGFDHDVDRVAL